VDETAVGVKGTQIEILSEGIWVVALAAVGGQVLLLYLLI
jgi:hypothetical protein